MQRSEFWPEPTAHRLYWERHNCPHVYEYDPTDDGPEVETTNAILATAYMDFLTEKACAAFKEFFGDLGGYDFGGLWT